MTDGIVHIGLAMSSVIIYNGTTQGRVPMSSNTRAKMVAGAADLMSRRGVNATSMRDVVRHTGTPRGSIGHHFPRGKQQLIEDALVFAGSQVSGPLTHLTQQHGAISWLRDFIALWRQTLERSKFQAGARAGAFGRAGEVERGGVMTESTARLFKDFLAI